MQVAAAVAALDPAHVAAALRDGRTVGIHVDGHDHELGPGDLLLALQPLPGYQLEQEGSHAVALGSRSTTTCAARAWRGRSSTRCRARARRPV